MRIHGVVWYFSAKTLLVNVLLYYSSAPISFCGIWRQRCVLCPNANECQEEACHLHRLSATEKVHD
jgi:hypothetical protein